MVKNGFEAAKLLNLYGNRLSEEILLKVWNTLINNCCDNEELRGPKYRTGAIEIGGYEGANYRKIEELMNGWITFYNSDNLDSEPFFKSALLHFAFETIHPFCDGNGRMGRLLINNYLISRGIESARAVSFSMEIDKNRYEYDSAFVKAENVYNDCTPFIEYMLNVYADSYYRAYENSLVTVNKGSGF